MTQEEIRAAFKKKKPYTKMDSITSEEYLQYKAKKPSKNKLGAIQVEYNGYKYASKKEADYAQKLDFRLKSKDDCLLKWEKQINFKLIVNGIHVTTYRLDFLETNKDGSKVHVDVKGRQEGTAYEAFMVKKKLMKALFNIDVIVK